MKKIDSGNVFDLIERANTDRNAAYSLGTMYLRGDGEHSLDAQRAFYYLRRSMDLGCVSAAVLLGFMYKYGEWGFPRDKVMATHYLLYAHSLDPHDEIILYELLDMYFHGDSGKPYNTGGGMQILEFAVEENETYSAFASYLLALIYHEGRYGIKKNLKKAEKYCTIALKKGYSGRKIEILLEQIKDAASGNKKNA